MLICTVIELRQHLCCANVFLKFKKSFTCSESLVKITVDDVKVKLQNPRSIDEIFVNKYFKILAGTIRNLIVDTENAAFRINIKDIQISDENDDQNVKNHQKINLNEQEETSVLCSNCESVLAAPKMYEKIREFPSGAIDVSEFFCHHGPSFKDVLVPSLRDLFYGFEFIVLNKEIIEKSSREKENHLYCKRCLRYLGETLFDGRAIKLWSDSVRFSLKGKVTSVFTCDERSKTHKLLLKAIDETSLPSPEPLLRHIHFTKILLEASFPNRQEQFLLLHILEKHLPVLTNKEVNAPSVVDFYDYTRIDLIAKKSFKILYRLIANDGGADNDKEMGSYNWPPLLEYWQQDINILKMKISPFLFKDLCEELTKNIDVLPEIYRKNKDDFLLSYIFY